MSCLLAQRLEQWTLVPNGAGLKQGRLHQEGQNTRQTTVVTPTNKKKTKVFFYCYGKITTKMKTASDKGQELCTVLNYWSLLYPTTASMGCVLLSNNLYTLIIIIVIEFNKNVIHQNNNNQLSHYLILIWSLRQSVVLFSFSSQAPPLIFPFYDIKSCSESNNFPLMFIFSQTTGLHPNHLITSIFGWCSSLKCCLLNTDSY